MAKSGKVIEFKPRDKRKLKTTDYVDPARKELLQSRDKARKKEQHSNQSVRYVSIFFLICVAVYLLTALR